MSAYLAEILTLTFTGFAAVYPLLLWITPRTLVDGGFYRFNQGMVSIIGSIGVVFFYISDAGQTHWTVGVIWIVIQLFVTAIYWNSKRINNFATSIPSILGISFLVIMNVALIPYNINIIDHLIIIIGHTVLAAVFFAMILGHWYLNVVQLPIRLLRNSVILLWILLGIRAIWNCYGLLIFEVEDSYGIVHSLGSFFWTYEGFLLSIAIFFGVLVPFVLNGFIWRTIIIQSTQSATGLLYVSVVAVIFGDLFYKNYTFQFGLIL